jgi:hypothetical protein
MKKTLLFISLFIIKIASGQVIYFPDANFKAKLLAADTDNFQFAGVNNANGYYTFIKLDANNNGEIEVSEAQQVNFLNIRQYFGSNSNLISDLTGIEYFANLAVLECQNNSISTINISNLIQLKAITCQYNQISNLDISNLINLKLLYCHNNQIQELDFTNLSNIENVSCAGNLITELDFHNNPLFMYLGCSENPNLTSINLKNGAVQNTIVGLYYVDCFHSCPNLTTICADDNEIQLLQNFLSPCISNSVNISSNCSLANEEFAKSELLIYPNPTRDFLNINVINNTAVSSVIIYNILGKQVLNILNPSNLIDISRLKIGTYLIKVISEKGIYNQKFIKE